MTANRTWADVTGTYGGPNAGQAAAPMSPLSLLLNILWMIFGGIWMAVGWFVAAVIMAITIVGILDAGGVQYRLLRAAAFRPEGGFARRISGHSRYGHRAVGLIGNVIWLVLAGWWLALGHLITAILLAVTIIGIPFAWAHLKLAGIALWPIGKMIVDADDVPLRYQRPRKARAKVVRSRKPDEEPYMTSHFPCRCLDRPS